MKVLKLSGLPIRLTKHYVLFFFFYLFSTFKFSLIKVLDNKGTLYKGTLGAQSKLVCVEEAKFCFASGKFGTVYTVFFLIIKERANAAEL